MINHTDPNVHIPAPNSPPAGIIGIIPQYQSQQTTANLGIAATINFDFTTDAGRIFDAFVFADQAIDVEIWIRQSATDTYRKLDNVSFAVGVANVLTNVIHGYRAPGSNVRIVFNNKSGVATTVLSAQVHVSSI